MTLVSIPANPAPENVVSGTIKTPDGAELRFARWAPPAGRKGTVCVFTGRSEQIEKYFETVRDLRDSRLCGGDDRLARAGPFVAAAARSAQGLCARFLRLRGRRRNLRAAGGAAGLPAAAFRAGHSMGGAVLLRVAHAGKRWFDRMVLSAPMIDLPAARHRAAGARCCGRCGWPARAALHSRRPTTSVTGSRILHQQSPDQRSRALRPQRRDPGGGPDARPRLADRGLGRYRVPRDARTCAPPTTPRRSASRS